MKKYLLPLGAGVVIFGAVTAFAATLNVNSTSLGAGNATVSSCQTNAAVSYATTGNTVSSATVTVSGLTGTPCDTLPVQVTLTGSGSALPVTRTGTIAGSSATLDFSSAGINAHDVTGVSVVVSG